jgi:hypothetical protein
MSICIEALHGWTTKLRGRWSKSATSILVFANLKFGFRMLKKYHNFFYLITGRIFIYLIGITKFIDDGVN